MLVVLDVCLGGGIVVISWGACAGCPWRLSARRMVLSLCRDGSGGLLLRWCLYLHAGVVMDNKCYVSPPYFTTLVVAK